MTEQPSRVTPDDIGAALLERLPPFPTGASVAERLAWFEARARLLTGIAAVVDTPDAHAAAADAWRECGRLAQNRPGGTGAVR